MSKLTTFIIPTIGRDTLGRSISSLKNQNLDNWKALVLFDGVKPTIESEPNIEVIHLNEKLGAVIPGANGQAGRVRNYGMKLVDTKWISFLDDDDYVTHAYTALLEKIDEESPDADLIIFRMYNSSFNTIVPPPGLNKLVENNFGISFSVKSDFVKKKVCYFHNSNTEDFGFLTTAQSIGAKLVLAPWITYMVGKPYSGKY